MFRFCVCTDGFRSDLDLGVMRIVNLAHPILIISGAFVSYWLYIKFGMDPILSVPAAALTVALLGVLLYKLIFEKNDYFIFPTVA